jgi:hypothetical protein
VACFRTLLSRLALQNSHEQALSNGSNPRGAGPTCLLKPGALTLGAKSSIPLQDVAMDDIVSWSEDRQSMHDEHWWKVIVLDWRCRGRGQCNAPAFGKSRRDLCHRAVSRQVSAHCTECNDNQFGTSER